MKIKKPNNMSIFMTKDDANSGSEDKAWVVKQYDLSMLFEILNDCIVFLE